ncbi:MAG: hypothetical protein ACI902_000391 [Psychroserpens sp.]|jgi:hypothetical protein
MITEDLINSLKTNTDLITYLNAHEADTPMYQSALENYE